MNCQVIYRKNICRQERQGFFATIIYMYVRINAKGSTPLTLFYDKGDKSMGDMMTEMVRRKNNYERFKNYLRKILDYLLNPNEDNFELVIAAAMNCDKSFLRGYWKERFDISVEENIRKSFKKILKELAEKNKIQWAKLLTQAMIV